MTLETIIRQLSASEHGREAMRVIREWMEELGGRDLHSDDVEAAIRLIQMWRTGPDSARDCVRSSLGE